MNTKKKYLAPIIGAVAFVVGGLLTRNKALEAVDILDEMLTRNKQSAPVEQ